MSDHGPHRRPERRRSHPARTAHNDQDEVIDSPFLKGRVTMRESRGRVARHVPSHSPYEKCIFASERFDSRRWTTSELGPSDLRYALNCRACWRLFRHRFACFAERQQSEDFPGLVMRAPSGRGMPPVRRLDTKSFNTFDPDSERSADRQCRRRWPPSWRRAKGVRFHVRRLRDHFVKAPNLTVMRSVREGASLLSGCGSSGCWSP